MCNESYTQNSEGISIFSSVNDGHKHDFNTDGYCYLCGVNNKDLESYMSKINVTKKQEYKKPNYKVREVLFDAFFRNFNERRFSSLVQTRINELFALDSAEVRTRKYIYYSSHKDTNDKVNYNVSRIVESYVTIPLKDKFEMFFLNDIKRVMDVCFEHKKEKLYLYALICNRKHANNEIELQYRLSVKFKAQKDLINKYGDFNGTIGHDTIDDIDKDTYITYKYAYGKEDI